MAKYRLTITKIEPKPEIKRVYKDSVNKDGSGGYVDVEVMGESTETFFQQILPNEDDNVTAIIKAANGLK